MKIHLLSDLHNEFSIYQPHTASFDADVIVLAGDIWNGAKGIAWSRETWPEKEIVYVPGNHEYYKGHIEFVDTEMKEAAVKASVHLLQDCLAVIDGVRFIGATLWTDFRLFGQEFQQEAMAEGKKRLNDFRLIWMAEWPLLPEQTIDMHNATVNFFSERLTEPFNGKTVVVTHHAPAWASVHPKFQQHPLSACFASRLNHLFGKVDLWLHGHMHDSFDYTEDGTRVVCNPRGYDRGAGPENDNFNPALLLEV